MTTTVQTDPPVVEPGPGRPPAPAPWRAGRLLPALGAVGWGLVGVGLLVAVWQLASLRAPDLPTPAASWSTLRGLLANPFYDAGPNDKGIGTQLAVSLVRVGKGFGLAAAVGIPAGLLIGADRRAWQALNPIVQLLRPVSPLAWFPIWLTVAGDVAKASVLVIFVTALWPVVINTAAGAAGVPQEQRDVARVFRFGRAAYLRHVIVPNALPGVVTGLRLSMGIAWMVIVAVEMLSGNTGIGYFVWDSYNTDRLPSVVSAIVVIGAVGMALDAAFLHLARRVAHKERAS